MTDGGYYALKGFAFQFDKSILDTLPSLPAREALLIGESVLLPSLVKIDECENPPTSSDIKYLEIWKFQ